MNSVERMKLYDANTEYLIKVGHTHGMVSGLLEIKRRISDVTYYQSNIDPRHVRKIAARDAKVKGLRLAYDALEEQLRELQRHLKDTKGEAVTSKARKVFLGEWPNYVPTPATEKKE